MGNVIDLGHFRRARRLFRLLVGRSGVESFLLGAEEESFRIDGDRLDDAVTLASTWLELRTGTRPTEETCRLMREDLRRLLIHTLAQHLVDTGH
jgi:hypothetical protein